MIVLGMDTATPATAVGLLLADGRTLEARDDPPPGERPGHSMRLLGLAHELLAQAGLGWRELDRIAVGVGPGTFTGLRIGVAAARGLAQSLGVELAGVSSLEALAAGVAGHENAPGAAVPEDAAAAGARENVLAAIDARRGEAFLAAYRDGHELLAPCVLPPERLNEAVGALPSAGWLAVGDGAVRFAGALRALGLEVPDGASPLHRIAGTAICALGARATPAEGLQVTPHYGRAPDAQPALQEAGR